MRSNAPRLARLARRHLSTPGKHIQQERSALKAVNTALVGNGCILGSKALAYLFGGSSSMLAECIHSSADIANQYLLRVGSLQACFPCPEPPSGHTIHLPTKPHLFHFSRV
jgi:hypothetical protein